MGASLDRERWKGILEAAMILNKARIQEYFFGRAHKLNHKRKYSKIMILFNKE
jgi:hypothetical protein